LALGQFDGQRYIALETFRRNGQGVKSPVWFTEAGGKLFVWTIGRSGKVKRIRKTPRVRFSPSTFSGKPKGDWVEAQARILDEAESELPRGMIRKRYGAQFLLLNFLHGRGRVIIELTPTV
jgi:PPOX class probable F420-dependent enzyme